MIKIGSHVRLLPGFYKWSREHNPSSTVTLEDEDMTGIVMATFYKRGQKWFSIKREDGKLVVPTPEQFVTTEDDDD